MITKTEFKSNVSTETSNQALEAYIRTADSKPVLKGDLRGYTLSRYDLYVGYQLDPCNASKADRKIVKAWSIYTYAGQAPFWVRRLQKRLDLGEIKSVEQAVSLFESHQKMGEEAFQLDLVVNRK